MELFLASADQQLIRDRSSYEAWGDKLTLEQFLQREQRLRGHAWARKALRTWFLSDGAGTVLASCETFRMESLHRQAGTTQRGITYAIASVYTDPPLRGRGYASAMFARLHPVLLSREPSAQATVLYSDVGEPLYARAGYAARPAVDWTFEPLEGDPAQEVDGLVGPDGLTFAVAAIPVPLDPFVVWPTAAQLDWHMERDRAYAEFLGRPPAPAWGARTGGGRILWARAAKGELNILLLHAESPAEASALIRSARRAAAAMEAPRVRLWEQPRPFTWPLPQDEGTRAARDGSLPMLRPLHPAVAADGWRTVPRGLWV